MQLQIQSVADQVALWAGGLSWGLAGVGLALWVWPVLSYAAVKRRHGPVTAQAAANVWLVQRWRYAVSPTPHAAIAAACVAAAVALVGQAWVAHALAGVVVLWAAHAGAARLVLGPQPGVTLQGMAELAMVMASRRAEADHVSWPEATREVAR